jgi:ATP-dependent DNA ligase
MPCFEGLHGRSGDVSCVIVFFAFDLLYLDGYDLTQCPLIARKGALKRILPKGDTDRLRYTEHVIGSGERLFGYSCGRSRLWQKISRTREGLR